jgi:hypothetical protein
MVRPTHDQIIRELSNEVTLLKEQTANLRRNMSGLQDLATRLALVEYQVAELRRGPER